MTDPSLDDFSRQEAAELIPKTNPFLRKLFQYVAGYDIDERIKTTVDNLANVFRATNVEELLKNFGKSTQTHDPIIHFYETFLAEYDPKLRKARGVWYTPEPVVNFIVRAVDDILKTEFGLSQGLADTTKTKIKLQSQTVDKRTSSGYKEYEREVHKVQILDPAAGTGTFLAEVVKHIYNKNFKSMQGAWSGYVEEDLIPRLYGFELLMASYAMAHLKLDMLLRETAYKPQKEQRFNVFLTNSLEEHHPDTGTLFASWLSIEANEANHIKRDTPVMVVLGNPPYSLSSSNKGKWIEQLMNDYKKNLNEKNIQPLSDDYIKFIRYGQYLVDKNGEGILAFITNNSFLDGVIHSSMRRSLLDSFDKIFILDLHGSLKRNEKLLDGTIDENVFDIQPGVSISIFIKKKGLKKKGLKIFDLSGKRGDKYSFCLENTVQSIKWKDVDIDDRTFMFKYSDSEKYKNYNSFISIIELMPFQTSGIKTHDDKVLTDFSIIELKTGVQNKYSKVEFNDDLVFRYAYRPLDTKFIFNSNKLLGRSREKTIYHLKRDNIGLVLVRQSQAIDTDVFNAVFITKNLTDTNMFRRGGPLIFPLFLYPSDNSLFPLTEQTPNMESKIVTDIARKIELAYIPKNDDITDTFSPIDILDYIYAVLHSPTYRERYKEFLKIDFPRVPYPKDRKTFWQLVKLGGELRQIHLLESSKVEDYITQYPNDGDNIITRKITKSSPGFELVDSETQIGKVWINDQQYFDNVPLVAWKFYIGGYQPAQKWLKDRSGRKLNFEDILHYQKIIVALAETDRIMKEINGIELE